MDIQLLYGVEGAKNATGITVVVDIIRLANIYMDYSSSFNIKSSITKLVSKY